MNSMTSNSNRFATWFNITYPDAPRKITAEDVEDLKECELIHRYGFYSASQDGKTVMSILKYEQKRGKRSERKSNEDKSGPLMCKMCGQPLPVEPEGKSGRPKEYCPKCSRFRSRERQKKLRQRHKKQFDKDKVSA
ncbi:hypothetical protein ACFLV5_04345 [Chloroflexota bacterium]